MKNFIFKLIFAFVFLCFYKATIACSCYQSPTVSFSPSCSTVTANISWPIRIRPYGPACQIPSFFPKTVAITIYDAISNIQVDQKEVTISNPSYPISALFFTGLNNNTRYRAIVFVHSITNQCNPPNDGWDTYFFTTGIGTCSIQTPHVYSPLELSQFITCYGFVAAWELNSCAINYQINMWNVDNNKYYDKLTILPNTGNFKFYGSPDPNNQLPPGHYKFNLRFSYKTCTSNGITIINSDWSPDYEFIINPSGTPIISGGNLNLTCSTSVFLNANTLTGGYWTVSPATAGIFSDIHDSHAKFTMNQNLQNCTVTWHAGCGTNSASIVVSNSFICGSDFEDPRDHHIYPTVYIGNQCWFKKSLNYSSSGGFESLTTSSTYLGTGSIFKYCYNNDPNNCANFGALYSGTTARMANVCPPCWRVPNGTDEKDFSDWSSLINNNYSTPTAAAIGLSSTSGFNGLSKNGLFSNPGYGYTGFNSPTYTGNLFCGSNPRCFVNNSTNFAFYWSSTPYPGQPANFTVQIFGGSSAPPTTPKILRYSDGLNDVAYYIRCVKIP